MTRADSTTATGGGSPEIWNRPLLALVAVGASAGGLSPTVELLRHLGPEPGVAVVIVHHLDPAHASSLADILARVTALPVQTVADGMPAKVNHVYVVPPNFSLGITYGFLKLTPRPETTGLYLPINHFFESLAADTTVHALAVVLSGTGADGTIGLEAIKRSGGITFAQDATAEYPGMPVSAISTGLVDFVLPADSMAEELIQHAASWPAPPTTEDDSADLLRISSAVRKSSDIDFTNYKRTTLRRRVARRIAVHRLSSLSDYADLVERSPEEARALSDDVLIHVTSFFRDPETFAALKATAFPRLLTNRSPEACVRVWVPGCSTGEEVYSIAMSLLEFLGDGNRREIPIKLFGTDVSAAAIDKARAAKYPTSIEHEVSPERLRRFFTNTDGRYQISKSVRDLCVFARQDATRDPPFAGMDLVSCRNLMIYLGSSLQDRLLPMFHYALKETGVLVLGSAETIRAFPGFTPLDAKNRIYARTSAAPPFVFDATNRGAVELAPRGLSIAARISIPQDVHREVDRLIIAEFSPPAIVITEDLAIVEFRGRTGPFLEPAAGVASFDLLRMVREEIRLSLRQTIEEARVKQIACRRMAQTNGPSPRSIELEVIPFRVRSTPQRFFVVLFREARPVEVEDVPKGVVGSPGVVDTQLLQESAATREYLQSVIEQLEATNEEMQTVNEEVVSSNEELRSTAEELQMAKQELQAGNEELRTVNDEMKARTVEVIQLGDDLTNVLSSVAMPIVLLGRDSRVRRITQAAARVFNLTPADVGRPIGDVPSLVPAPDLARMIADVLERLGTVERTVQDVEGRWYQIMVLPYRTLDDRIDGTVIVAIDIDASKRGTLQLDQARRYAESIVDTLRVSLVVLAPDGRVRSANRTFLQVFGFVAKDIESRSLYELGRGEWNIPALRTRLGELGEGDTLEGYRVERDVGDAGRRVFILNARRIQDTPSILLVIEDITEKERAELALQQTEFEFREILTTAGEAILMTDAAGRVVFANHSSARVFGFGQNEMVGLPVDALIPDWTREQPWHSSTDALIEPSPRPDGHDRELCARRKDGTEFPIEIVLSSMLRESGALAVIFVTDVSRRRESDKRLRDYQDRLLRLAFNTALVEERERRRIAAEVHDQIGQSLALAQIKLTSMRDAIAGAPRATLDEAVALLAQSIIDTRTLIFDLSPPVLYELGLKEALSWLVEEVEKRHGVLVELVDDSVNKPLDDMSAALVFRAVRELLTNVFKHAGARAAKVSLRRDGADVEITVEDHGVGFELHNVGAHSSSGGFGLFSVREQIGRLGGTLEVVSAPGHGTRVSLRVPLKAGEPVSKPGAVEVVS